LLVVVYFFSGKDLLAPTIWLLIGWFFSVLFATTKLSEWGDISGKTVIVVFIGLISFIIGGIIGKHTKAGKSLSSKEIEINYKQDMGIVCKPVFLVFSIMILIYTVYVDYRFVLNAAIYGGYSGGANLLSYARDSMLNDITMPYSIYIPIALSQACAYIIAHSLIYDVINLKDKKTKGNYWIIKSICVLLFVIIAILSTGRTMIMYFLLFILSDACIQLTLVNGRSRKNNRRIVKYGLIAIVAILGSFVAIDIYFRASKYGVERNPIDQVIKYTSSSLYAFDVYLQSPTKASETGYETLYNVFSILRRIGLDYEKTGNTLPFVSFSNITTNVYTALRRYIHDFGYGGMIIIQLFMGFIYEYAYKRIMRNTSTSFAVIIYCSFVFAPVFNCIEERFLINVLSLRSLMIVAFVYVIIHLINRFSIGEKSIVDKSV
jgi:oligosaccharide repeat unit polymerase